MLFAASPWPVPSQSGSQDSRVQAGIAHGFIAVFSFLLASFPARNPEIWQHLAAGRDLAHGRLPGVSGRLDPGWLFDLAAYAVYSVGGGAGLVVAKAVLIAGLGVLLLRLGRT